ncbi:hypothetical protein PNOK_0508400 [Pyrrhoderma noxium]|uniref:Uncharacterized protein n=1 Tax=Pyrrhoderma noxium TaxID=2282107 RepID=A0A286UKP0_9AGAM|nr:hypothetical protein PNOK_0508400 [Pyrrhoderma noxium]
MRERSGPSAVRSAFSYRAPESLFLKTCSLTRCFDLWSGRGLVSKCCDSVTDTLHLGYTGAVTARIGVHGG